MQSLADLWQAIPHPLHDPVALAVPFFLLFVGLEGLAAYLLEDERPDDQRRSPDGRDTHHIVRLQTREYAAIVRDVRRTPRLRDKLGYVFGPPGWRPDPRPMTSAAPRRGAALP